MALTTVDAGLLNSQSQQTWRNRIINGAMVIDQRNAGASVTPSGSAYTLDRWYFDCSQASKMSVQQTPSATETGYATRVGAGFTNYIATTTVSAYTVGAGDYFWIAQFIEGLNISDLAWGTSNAKTVTLSFLAYSSLTGTFGGALQNSDSSRSYPFSYTISSANTWTPISITIAGDTTGTWLTTNGKGIRLSIGLGVGSTRSGTAGAWAGTNYASCTGATSVVGTSSATFYVTGVQLEKGSTATSFDYRPYGTELQLCQRYFSVQSIFPVVIESGTISHVLAKFATEMRTSPSASYVSGLYAWNPIASNQPINSISSIGSTYNTTSGCQFNITTSSMASVSAGMASYTYQNVAGAGSIQFSAEL
jgi:hypothetical protein